MAKIDSYKRWLLIIQKIKKNPSSFDEIKAFLKSEEEILGYKFDISIRTFQRDLTAIESYYGIEIKFNKRSAVYEIIEEENNKDYGRIIEAFEIMSALNTSKKMANYIFLENRQPIGSQHFHGIIHAIRNKLEVIFSHENYWEGTIKKRNCVPIAIKEAQNRWYLIGFDLEKKEIRNYGLDRISELEITKNKKDNPKLDVENFYKNAFGIETYFKAEKIILEIENSQKKYVKTLPLHTSQKIVAENENTFLLELFMHPTYDFKMELLRLGSWCKIIEPIWYRNEMKEIITKMNKKYE